MIGSFIIGISGGSGSGKTTFARQIQKLVGVDKCGILLQDSYYFDQSQNFKGDGSVNYDHPNAIDFSLLSLHLDILKSGQEIQMPQYCFKTHKRLDEFVRFSPKPIIVTDGILILSQPQVRRVLDSSVFIDTSEEVRFQRRLARDVKERGRTPEGVKKQFIETVKPMHDQFVEPSKVYADFIYSGERKFNEHIEAYLDRLGLDHLKISQRDPELDSKNLV